MSASPKRPAPTLERVTFKTSRLAEFCGEKELTSQTGHPKEEWPLVILKELVDNALDAAEEAEIAPEIHIEVSTERGEIVIADNGPGIPAETIEGVLDYASRVSSREAYVSPTRGAQGNALKTIVAMPFALDGARGTTVIEAHGLAHRIIFEMDPVRREPRVFPGDFLVACTKRHPDHSALAEFSLLSARRGGGPFCTNGRRLHDL